MPDGTDTEPEVKPPPEDDRGRVTLLSPVMTDEEIKEFLAWANEDLPEPPPQA